MKLLVFQHVECEHPGSMRQFLQRDGNSWDAVELDEGEPIPYLEGYDALWVVGGPMDVWDIEDNPWLVPEKAAIRTWVRDMKKPFLGWHCQNKPACPDIFWTLAIQPCPPQFPFAISKPALRSSKVQ